MQKYQFNFTLPLTIAFLVVFLILIKLGFWQLDRADEKKAHNESYKSRQEEQAINLNDYKNKNDILERDHALKAIWGDDNYFNGRSMDVYIAKLRKYLKHDEQIQIINVHGRGFKLLT